MKSYNSSGDLLHRTMDESLSRDQFSELPDSLIHHIFSFLPIRDVVSTTFLSKRWNNLWTTVPYLDFCEQLRFLEDNEVERVRSFGNWALKFWVGTKILRFKVDFDCVFQSPLVGYIDYLVCFAVANKVEELKIHLSDYYYSGKTHWINAVTASKKYAYMAPPCLNSCSSIRELSLVGCNLCIPVSPSWNQLKSLKIDGFCLSEGLINQIMLGSPRLEVFELRLLESNQNLNIQSTSLKKLKIEKYLHWDNDRPSKRKVLRIHCPNLVELEISGALYSKYEFSNVSSLTAATLRLCCHKKGGERASELLGGMLSQFFSTAQHVEKVTLSDWNFQVLGLIYTPLAVPNVKFLKLDVCETDLEDMQPLFEFFPNIMTLVIEDQSVEDEFEFGDIFDYETRLPAFQHLKTIEITSIFYSASIFFSVEFLLKNASMLEKLVIRPRGDISREPECLHKVAETLLSLSRSSPNAKVIFKTK